MQGTKIDMLNKRFGRLTVIEEASSRWDGKAQWLCLCDCGKKKLFLGKYLRNGDSKSCGCLQREFAGRFKGQSKLPPKPKSKIKYSGRTSHRNSYLKRLYGMSLEDYDQMLKDQDSLCPICEKELDGKIDIDHCHTTGKVRALLHSKCNRLLGCAEDNVYTLANAITYLHSHRIKHSFTESERSEP